MKRTLMAFLGLCILLQSCDKAETKNPQDDPNKPVLEKPKEGIPEKPSDEGKKPEPAPPPSNNNGIVHGVVNQELSYNKFITLDMNADGKNDLYFTSALVMDSQSHLYLFASSISTSGGKLLLDKGTEMGLNGLWASPLKQGNPIREQMLATARWSNYMTKAVLLDVIEKVQGNELNGPWVAKDDQYIGVQLLIDNKPHYGWIKVSHQGAEQKLYIAEFAYNLTPSEELLAGQKSK